MNGKIISRVLRILPFCVAILCIIEIVVINHFASSGRTILAIDTSIDSLHHENDIIEQYIASASSLMTIAERSKGMGFIEPAKSQYLTIVPEQLPVALQNPR